MKLRQVRLHPFGGVKDRTHDLGSELAIVFGPNEMGKSTLRQAIYHALFTPTNLTPAALRNSIRRWFPAPAGDHAAVSVTFEHAGCQWRLSKRWGIGHGCLLESDAEAAMADPRAVQDRLQQMLGHSEATFRHVLFTGQAELEQTLVALRRAGSELRDVRDLMRAARDAHHDFDQQRFETLLETKIRHHFQRWDEQRQGPERENGQERGIERPWRRDVGAILKAWYRWQQLVVERAELQRLEQEIDRINEQLTALEQQWQGDQHRVQHGQPLRAGLTERLLLEERLPRVEQQLAAMGQVLGKWPAAEEAQRNWGERRQAIEQQLQQLHGELQTAHTRRQSEVRLATFQRIEEAQRETQAARARCEQHPQVAAPVLAEAIELAGDIRDMEIQLAAQQLSWELSLEPAGEVRLQAGAELPEMRQVGPEGLSGLAAGRVQIEARGVRVTLRSGGQVGDDDPIERLGPLRARLTELLAQTEAASLLELQQRATSATELAWKLRQAESTLVTLLGGETFEQWQTLTQQIRRLPATREIDAINAEIAGLQSELARGDARNQTLTENIRSWQQAYGDPTQLLSRMVSVQLELQQTQQQLAQLPTVPTGYDSVQAFFSALDRANTRLTETASRRSALEVDRGRLEGQIGERRSEDLVDQAEQAEREFRRLQQRGLSYRRIQDVLHRITQDGHDPVVEFSRHVSAIFSRITGDTIELTFDGSVPDQVQRESVTLPAEQLSQGTSGALALALRLALAEAHLGPDGGFLLLDDPLVHFDAERMAQATRILHDYASRMQIIFFTCHAPQAELLTQLHGA
jgi:DNA repair protein SbcC/Rad50